MSDDERQELIRRLLFRRVITDPPTNSRVKGKCWEWSGCRNPDGYGKIKVGNEVVYTHRLSAAVYLRFNLRSKLLVKHRCNNSACFNPAHLEPGTHAENNNEAVADGLHRNCGTLSDSDVAKMIWRVRKGMNLAKWAALNGIRYCTVRRAYLGITHTAVAQATHARCDSVLGVVAELDVPAFDEALEEIPFSDEIPI